MVKKRLIIFMMIYSLIMSISVSGCKSKIPSFDEEMADADNTLVWNLSMVDITSWDPHLDDSSVVYDINRQLFEGLTVIGENGYELGAAESFTVSSNSEGIDNTVYTFKIREDAKWSDGKDLTANDFEYSFKRACGQKNSILSETLGLYIKGADEYINGKSSMDNIAVSSIDEKTLKIELEEPVPYFPQILAVLFPVRQDVVEGNGEGWETNPDTCISNGPYSVYYYESGSYILLSKNNNYYDRDNIKVPYVKCLINTASNNQFSHVVRIYPDNDIDINADNILVTDYIGTSYIIVNTKKEPLNDVNVRRALYYSLDRKYLCDSFFYESIPAVGIIPSDMRLYDGIVGDKRTGHNYTYIVSPEEAKKLISNTKYKDDFPEIELTVIREYDGQVLKSMIENNAGIKITINVVSFDELMRKDSEGDYEMILSSWTADYYDPMAYLTSFVSDSENRLDEWYNYDFEEAIANSIKSEGSKRDTYLMQAEKILIDELPVIPISHYKKVYFFDNKIVENLKCDVMGNPIIKGCKLKNKNAENDSSNINNKEGFQTEDYIKLQFENEKFIFHSADKDKECIEDLVKALDTNYDKITQNLGVILNDKVKIIIYPDIEVFHNNVGIRNEGDWLVGIAEENIIHIVSPLNPGTQHTYESIMKAIVHEFVHVVQHNIYQNYPYRWMNDGLATYFANQVPNGRIMDELIDKDEIPSLMDMNGKKFVEIGGYDFSYTVVEYLVEKYGYETIVEMLKAPDNIEEILGKTLDEFEKDWVDYLKENW